MSTPPSAQTIERLRQASTLLFQRRPADAAVLLAALIREQPELIEARRLLGIAFREKGDPPNSERELRLALEISERPDLYEALGTTLEVGGHRPGAEQAYRQALAMDPAFSRAAVGLSELLLNENRPAEALSVIASIGVRSDADLHALSAHALALKALRRFDEAIAVSRRAVAVAPRSAVAEHNLAAALADTQQFAEAEAAVRRAFSKGLDAPQSWLLLGRALQGQDRYDEAEQAFRQAIARHADFADAHDALAQLVWMRTGEAGAACTGLDAALLAHPANARLRAGKASVLEYAGETEAAYQVLTEAIARQASDPGLHIQASHLVAASRPEQALAHAERAAALAPDSQAALSALCLANLAVGQAQAAANLAGVLRERAPLDQHALALQATAWRLLGDPRYAELYDYEAMVRSWTIDTPPGWSDLGAFLADLAQSLDRRHTLRAHPIGQSLRQGVQTQQRLDRSEDPVVRAFFQAIDGPIRRHIEVLGSGPDPLRMRSTGSYRIEGAWSVRLRPHGYHADHLHSMGWLSSACYIVLPGAVEQGREGWIKFGQPGVPTNPSLAPEHFVKPDPGMLVLFPSYMWHGTVPFGGEESRLTVAFDLLPG